MSPPSRTHTEAITNFVPQPTDKLRELPANRLQPEGPTATSGEDTTALLDDRINYHLMDHNHSDSSLKKYKGVHLSKDNIDEDIYDTSKRALTAKTKESKRKVTDNSRESNQHLTDNRASNHSVTDKLRESNQNLTDNRGSNHSATDKLRESKQNLTDNRASNQNATDKARGSNQNLTDNRGSKHKLTDKSRESNQNLTDKLTDSSQNLSSCSESTLSTEKLRDSPQDSLNSLLRKESKERDCIEEALECTSLTNNVCAMNCSEQPKNSTKRRFILCGTVGQAVSGTLLLLVSLVSFVFTPLDFLLWEKLNMRPGLPPFDWWSEPPDEVMLRMYVFNVTNHERFMAGLDAKIHLQEIGPILYLEKLEHYNVSFNDNSTMTYTARRTAVYLPDRNTIDLEQKMIVPNLAVLGLASYLYDAPYLMKAAFRFMVQSHSSDFFIEMTIQQYLWDFRDPVLDTSRSLVPGLVPVDNMGMLTRMYGDFVDNVTVTIGSEWGHKKFFQLDRFHGEPQLPGYDPKTCPDRVFGSTEGVMYAQRLTKQDRLLYWRKSVCKVMPLYFDEEVTVDDIPVYRYNLSEQVFDRVRNGTDCYDSKPPLPDGLSDASRCFFDFPMVISYPHFYTGVPPKDTYVTGLTPDRYKHNSYAIVEPLTGTPLRSVARMQSNLRVNDLSGFGSQYDRFSNLVLPMFWGEYNQEGLPDYIRKAVYFAAVVLPPVQTLFSALFLFIGCCLLVKLIYFNELQNKSLATLLPTFKARQNDVLTRNRIFNMEKDSIINKYT